MFKETVIAVHWICRLFWKVFPITSYPIAEINQNSIRIVNQHKGAFPNERLLKQVSRESVYWLLNFLTSHQFKKEKLHFFFKVFSHLHVFCSFVCLFLYLIFKTISNIFKQRQQLRAVPVTEVHYTWDQVSTRYWIYGLERRVHAPDYPQQCCWGCTIL